MEQIMVREATLDDCQVLAWLNRLFNGGDGDAAQMRRQMVATVGIERPFLAFLDQQPVGFACLRFIPMLCDPEPVAELTELFVLATARRRGVGRALTTHVETVARQEGAKELGLLTGLNNQVAQDFYRAVGYKDDALAMKKSLPN